MPVLQYFSRLVFRLCLPTLVAVKWGVGFTTFCVRTQCLWKKSKHILRHRVIHCVCFSFSFLLCVFVETFCLFLEGLLIAELCTACGATSLRISFLFTWPGFVWKIALQKAKASNTEWVCTGRTWDYHQLCEILPERHSRLSMVKELLSRGFFIQNQPDEPELDLETADSTAVSTPSNKNVYPDILKAAKADFIRICGNLQKGSAVSNADKTLYRY